MPDRPQCSFPRYVYSRAAATQLARSKLMSNAGIPLAGEWLRNKAHGVKSSFGMISASVALMTMGSQAARDVQPDWTEEQQAQYAEKMMGKVPLPPPPPPPPTSSHPMQQLPSP